LIVNESELKLDTVAISIFTEEDKLKLDSIEEGAEVNVQSDWNETDPDSDAFILNKPDPAAAQIPQIYDGIAGTTVDFIAGQTTFTLPVPGATCIFVSVNDGEYSKRTAVNTSRVNSWSQTGDVVTIYTPLASGRYIVMKFL